MDGILEVFYVSDCETIILVCKNGLGLLKITKSIMRDIQWADYKDFTGEDEFEIASASFSIPQQKRGSPTLGLIWYSKTNSDMISSLQDFDLDEGSFYPSIFSERWSFELDKIKLLHFFKIAIADKNENSSSYILFDLSSSYYCLLSGEDLAEDHSTEKVFIRVFPENLLLAVSLFSSEDLSFEQVFVSSNHVFLLEKSRHLFIYSVKENEHLNIDLPGKCREVLIVSSRELAYFILENGQIFMLSLSVPFGITLDEELSVEEDEMLVHGNANWPRFELIKVCRSMLERGKYELISYEIGQASVPQLI